MWPVQGPWRDRVIIAMDAMELDVWEGEEEDCPIRELNPRILKRELEKAYCGFSAADELYSSTSCPAEVSTGHWGCGAFGGNREAKALIQVKKYFFSNIIHTRLILLQELSSASVHGPGFGDSTVFIDPQHACAARVIVIVPCVCVCVCVCVCTCACMCSL